MTKRLSPLLFLLTRFPRAHIAATLALAGLLAVALLVPETGSSIPNRMDALELPLPSRAASRQDNTDDEQPQRQWQEITVRSGDTLGNLLRDHGVSANQVHLLVSADPILKQQIGRASCRER